MLEYRKIRPAMVMGPTGEALTLGSLPRQGETRWVARRKAEVVAAVDGGLITLEEALERYQLSLEEFNGWRATLQRAGIPGLRITQAQRYRDLLRSHEAGVSRRGAAAP